MFVISAALYPKGVGGHVSIRDWVELGASGRDAAALLEKKLISLIESNKRNIITVRHFISEY